MNWLATHIPSLRDFTRDIVALHGTTCPYLVPTGLLHGATRPYTVRQHPYTPERPYTAQRALISSLRDYYTAQRALTRCASTLTRPKGLTRHNVPSSRPYGTFTPSFPFTLSTARKRFSTSAEGASLNSQL